jgi:hypothetical protein
MLAYNAEYILFDFLRLYFMSDDAPKAPIDDSASECDRELDAYAAKRLNASGNGASVLRKMFSEYPAADKPANSIGVANKPSIQQSKPSASFLFAPTI